MGLNDGRKKKGESEEMDVETDNDCRVGKRKRKS